MAIDAMINRDLPLIQGLVLTFAVMFIVAQSPDRPPQRLARPEAAAWLISPACRSVRGGGASASTRAPSPAASIIAALFLTALAAPLLAPHDPLEQDLLYTQLPPSLEPGGDPALLLRHRQPRPRYPLAPDLRRPHRRLIVAVVAASLACLVGSFSASSPAISAAWSTPLVSRLIDIWMSFPPVLLSIVLAAAVGAGLGSVVLAIVVIDWTRFSRVVRAETQLQRQLDYVAAARVVGLRRGRTLFARDPAQRRCR